MDGGLVTTSTSFKGEDGEVIRRRVVVVVTRTLAMTMIQRLVLSLQLVLRRRRSSIRRRRRASMTTNKKKEKNNNNTNKKMTEGRSSFTNNTNTQTDPMGHNNNSGKISWRRSEHSILGYHQSSLWRGLKFRNDSS